jgi:proteasome lid subunit RPN8/RPN11
MGLERFREHSYLLTGERREQVWLMRRRQRTIGTPSSVEAAWQQALAREEKQGDVLGFFHTHPQHAGVVPSARDIRTMQVWCLALGKPLLCVIQCGPDIKVTLFCDDADTGRPLQMVGTFARGVMVAVDNCVAEPREAVDIKDVQQR